jgi:hypothetical protein
MKFHKTKKSNSKAAGPPVGYPGPTTAAHHHHQIRHHHYLRRPL